MYFGAFSLFGELNSGKEFSVNGSLYNATIAFNVGDTIGFHLEFVDGQGSLSVFKNGVRHSTGLSNIEGPVFPVLSVFSTSAKVTLNPKSIPSIR